jgi:hypothetical protein
MTLGALLPEAGVVVTATPVQLARPAEVKAEGEMLVSVDTALEELVDATATVYAMDTLPARR